MDTSRDEIFRVAMSLAELAAALLATLDPDVEAGVEEAWRREIERRASELESGAVERISWSVSSTPFEDTSSRLWRLPINGAGRITGNIDGSRKVEAQDTAGWPRNRPAVLRSSSMAGQ